MNELLGGNRFCARRSQFDRERNALQPGANVGYGIEDLGREVKVCLARVGSIGKEAYAVVDTAKPKHLFLLEMQDLTTRNDDPNVRRGLEQLADKRCKIVDEMFGVIEDEQRACFPEMLEETSLNGAVSVRIQPDGFGDGGRYTRRIVNVSQRDEPRAGRKPGERGARIMRGQARLAHSSKPNDRHEAVIANEEIEALKLAGTPDEGGALRRDIAAGQWRARGMLYAVREDGSFLVRPGHQRPEATARISSVVSSKGSRAPLSSTR
ncbi:MAG TPA: hypothetical protein VK760_00185 [Candidatus Acidoferrales bacterium]|nr:hypothetical protein [Candidatus Acidoferrales bacterium]